MIDSASTSLSRSPVHRLPSPGFRNRCYRLLWGFVRSSLFRWSPVPLHGWRRMLLRIFGAKIEAKTAIYPTAQIWAPNRLVMRRGSCLAAAADCYNVTSVELERGCVVSQKAYLCTASHDIDDPDFALVGAPITIGESAWVAAGAFIGPGVRVGENAVVAAAAVVTRDIPPHQVVAGNPAVPVRQRKVKP